MLMFSCSGIRKIKCSVITALLYQTKLMSVWVYMFSFCELANKAFQDKDFFEEVKESKTAISFVSTFTPRHLL